MIPAVCHLCRRRSPGVGGDEIDVLIEDLEQAGPAAMMLVYGKQSSLGNSEYSRDRGKEGYTGNAKGRILRYRCNCFA